MGLAVARVKTPRTYVPQTVPLGFRRRRESR